MKDNKLLSIIVPVYNVENYLEECITSIINANFESYEIVLVDDGSTDNSGKICEELKNKHSDVISVIHKKNGGLSSARNAGIKVATGTYLMFVDSDDRINKFDLRKYIENNSDIIQYKMVYFYENTGKYVELSDIQQIDSNDDIMEIIHKQIINGTLSISACDKIIKRDIIIENSLFFEEGLLSEDINWSLELYLHVNSISVFNESIYIYRQQRVGSITDSPSNKSIMSLIFILDKWLNYDYKSEKIKNVYKNYLAYIYCILITISDKNNTTKEQRNFIKKHNFIIKYDDNYKVKYCHRVIKVFGIFIGSHIFKIYLKMKNKGMIKI